MYENLIGKTIDKGKEEFSEFPEFLNGQIFILYDKGFITQLPIVAPNSITMRQARLALLDVGLLGQVDNAIQSLPSPQKEQAQIEWEYASEVRRDNPLITQLMQALGMNETELDNLFIEGAKQ